MTSGRGGSAGRGLAAAARALASQVTGPVLLPGDRGYDDERAGFQATGPHQPAVAVGAARATDVVRAVQFAAARGLPVALQATGHGLTVTATGGVLISTRRMSAVQVNPRTQTAWIEAGARWEHVIRAAAPHGLAPVSGSTPAVGAVSYTLGGGIGLLARRYGYAADRVRRLLLVTADGSLRRVSADDEPDLFWALRGGGGSLGAVTSLEIGLVPLRRLYGGGLYFDGARAAEVLGAWLAWTATVPDELTSSVAIVAFPDLPAVPAPVRGRLAVHLRIAYAGRPEAGERLITPLRGLGPRLTDTVAELPYTEAGAIYADPTQPMGYRSESVMVRDLGDPALAALLGLAQGPPASLPVMEIRHLGGALARAPAAGSAVGHRDARYVLTVLSRLPPGDIPPGAPTRPLPAAITAQACGRCANFTFGAPDPACAADYYEPGDYSRLTEIKAAYDPAGIFRFSPHAAAAI